jgi:transcriptional regulator with XRE-family HTH domain
LNTVTEVRQADPIDVAVGARIRMRRKVLKVSQGALASALGITFQQVQKYERGANRVSASMLVKIARRLDCTVASLIGEDGGSVDDGLAPRLAVPGALELLHAFSKLESTTMRRRILDLMTVLADGESDLDDETAAAPRRKSAN